MSGVSGCATFTVNLQEIVAVLPEIVHPLP
jgi:hypothetical protein